MSIDRDDLRMILTERYGREYDITDGDLDDILALDVPHPGIILTPEEAVVVRGIVARCKAAQ